MVHPFSHLDDQQLMLRYQQGENMAFEALYLRHKDRVYSYLDKRVYDKDAIEDIFQNIFTKFHRSRHLYREEFPVLKWIYTISRSELLDYIKKNKVQFVELNEEHLQAELDQPTERIDLDSVKSLSRKEKEAIELRYYGDQDFEDIAKTLETSSTNSRKLISRGLKKLKTKLLGENT